MRAAMFSPSPAGGGLGSRQAASNLEAPLALTPTLSQREREQQPVAEQRGTRRRAAPKAGAAPSGGSAACAVAERGGMF